MMRTTKVRTAIMSHISYAQYSNLKTANIHLNFAKYLLIQYDDVDIDIAIEELDRAWAVMEKSSNL